MNIYEVLSRDHRRVDEMFEEILTHQDLDLVRMQMQQIRNDLMSHTELEETLFYPFLREPEVTRDLIRDSYREHAEVERLLGQWEDCKFLSQEWKQACKRLQQTVLEHVQEEEQKLFPKAQRVISEERAQQLGQQALQRKQQQVGQRQ